MSKLLSASIIAPCLAIFLSACGSGPQPQPQAQQYPEPVFSADRMLFEDDKGDAPTDVYDPWVGMNKRIYNFNYNFDRLLFLPAVRGYNWLLPQFVRTGVSNFFNNFGDMTTAVNSVLQLSPEKFFTSTGRVVINSTFGIFGLFDVASAIDVPRPDEDFGQTLGYWGVGQGPYLVVPFLGPSNLRDGFGTLTDFYVQKEIRRELWTKDMRTYGFLLEALDTRANTSFRYYETGSAFEYRTVRMLWSTKRELDVAK